MLYDMKIFQKCDDLKKSRMAFPAGGKAASA
jgi:hypothetical protein